MARDTSQKGFTLIELIVVLVIIGILAAGFVVYTRSVQTSATAKAEVAFLHSVAAAYKMVCNLGVYDTGTGLMAAPLGAGGAVTSDNLNTVLGAGALTGLTAPGNIPGMPQAVPTFPSNCPSGAAARVIIHDNNNGCGSTVGVPQVECTGTAGQLSVPIS